ncbi:uncharacterized protein LOC131620243 [Vicia villosa]|uniref:uncharacterized protein LOC131620243 n=1 Tax=Vicia villosa TaxID=3911 RepID=UPI00273A76DF|nr:uncharacterized protein LOC131620243 [Vicia villosa]
MTTVTTLSYRFKINGSYTDSMAAKRGIRQGDPLSPLLFVITMEYLNRLLCQMQDNPKFHYHSKCKRIKLTNLIFADDLLLFARGDQGSVELLQHTLHTFLVSTGLKVNPSKSCIYFGGVPSSVKDAILHMTSYKEGSLPFKYLGVPITSRNLNVIHYMPLLDKLLSRINHWTSKLLSYAGRLQLIKSVLNAISSYWMQCFAFPKIVLKKIESLCRTFLWTGSGATSRKSPIAWESICKPNIKGGLGTVNLVAWNCMFLMKLLWNINAKVDSLWVQWVHAYYLKHDSVMVRAPKQTDSAIFKAILQQRDRVQQHNEGQNLLQDNRFNGRKFYKLMQTDCPDVSWANLVIHNRARSRAVFTLWMLCHRKLPTRMRLHRWGLVHSTVCVFCDQDETIDHLFFSCETTKRIWRSVLNWLHIQHDPDCWEHEVLCLLVHYRGKGWRADLTCMALAETVYAVWRFRNDKCFGHIVQSKDIEGDIINGIVYRGWTSPKLRPHIANLLIP